MRIAELAPRVRRADVDSGRYYEQAWGCWRRPTETASGYRDYDDEAVARLLFISHAGRMGVSCEQIAGLLPMLGAAPTAAPRRIETRS